MGDNVVRLSESELKSLVVNEVRKVLSEQEINIEYAARAVGKALEKAGYDVDFQSRGSNYNLVVSGDKVEAFFGDVIERGYPDSVELYFGSHDGGSYYYADINTRNDQMMGEIGFKVDDIEMENLRSRDVLDTVEDAFDEAAYRARQMMV